MAEDIQTAVIGAGAWGTALAWSLAERGAPVTLWARETEVVDTINQSRENRAYLPGVTLPQSLRATSDIAGAARGARIVLLVIPTQFMRAALTLFAPHIPPEAALVSAAKGIENETLALPVEIIEAVLGKRAAAASVTLTGPTFAREFVRRAPTAATLASADEGAARRAQAALSAPWFRLYIHHDVIGAELAGALKNVIAIAAGIADGLGFGNNTRAALITRGLAEITRLGAAMGADPRTFSGLAGVGDLTLTCTSDLSRNHTVGFRLGKGEQIGQITASMRAVAEGVATARAAVGLARKFGVETPIAEEVYRVLYENKEPGRAVADLMNRAPRAEF
ncbi:MAG: NAD(P)-dependent glycerol-3-phosphate dehydrogenase [Nitrospinae bacterium]|nr:NAD(P)-dependent glycerol-3-phosphate dehydrogenase [Nitrospinota bacterium]